jgi:hypothetical protein
MATIARSESKVIVDRPLIGKPNHDGIQHCSRCGGLMVIVQLIDLPAQRCVQCGELVDPVILHNRQQGDVQGLN